jgi:putative hydrolase of the HAD superfamily
LPKITALFWDVGGVLLSNAWDHDQRGKISLQNYLERTVFYRPRSFTAEAFTQQMFSLSTPIPDSLQLGRELNRSGKYLMSTINNESKELNLHRIQTFGLREIFSLFVSSCFVGLRKPEEGIYRLALEITQRPPEECCFIDDRPLNLDSAARLGMHVIQMKTAEQLRADLQKLGVAG